MRRLLLIALLMGCPLSAGAAQNPEVIRAIDGSASRAVVQLLARGDMQAVARALAYPASYSPAELQADTKGVAGGLNVLLSHFGQPSDAAPESAAAVFYELSIATGPSVFWWQAEPQVRTRQYIYRARFSRAGPGYIKILTRVARGAEQPVSISFGLSVDLPRSKASVDTAYQAASFTRGA